MKIKIDKNKCYGCGSCMALEPDIFEINTTDGLAKVSNNYINIDISDPEIIKKIQLAADSCPNGAISLE